MADDTKKRRMTPEELKEKIDSLQKRHQAVLEKRAAVGGQLQAKKQELALIVEEIKQAGYDPKNLAAEYEKAEQDLEGMIVEFDKKLTEVETALAVFDKK
jgi:chromosome segregation ATPase